VLHRDKVVEGKRTLERRKNIMTTRTASPPQAQRSTRPSRDGAATRLFATKNDLSPSTRGQVAALLNQRLADCIDLQTQCKQAHWNVKGPTFIALHKLFDEVNEEVEEYVDLLAERIVQLGGVAEGTAREVASRSRLEEYPDLVKGQEHVDALSSALATFGHGTRVAINEADELGDPATADILTEVTRGIDKWLWFVEAHQQDSKARTDQ
jgi:starvation-inducible DNA-binding protein